MRVLPVIICIVLLQGCICPKKYARYINEVYNANYSAHTDSSLVIRSTVPMQFDSLVKVEKGKHYFIPVFVYYGIKESYECELNPRVPANIFTNECYRYAHIVGLDKKLKGRRLELMLTSLPRQFTFTQKVDIIVPVYFLFSKFRQSIYPKLTYLTFSYKLYSGNSLVRTGEITMDSNEEPCITHTLRKKVTQTYLGNYEQKLKTLTRDAVDRLMVQL